MVCPCVALPLLIGGTAGASLRKNQIYVLLFMIATVIVLFFTYKKMDENCSKCKAF